ncbi:hypothetical protein B0H66DRAFT_600605 [Apodospora peruviana]|uniref:Uncharacterized protein n=1 Tax=Apodospora peruviana TaxID=516989 RepID=A0AAE0IK19_9PEZI|nr:hypothetical protein B0H66DRAFT_600605 [Apodospora peruviana]
MNKIKTVLGGFRRGEKEAKDDNNMKGKEDDNDNLLYLGLYHRNKPRSYHYALLTGHQDPSTKEFHGRIFHAKNILVTIQDDTSSQKTRVEEQWTFQETDTATYSGKLLALVAIARISHQQQQQQQQQQLAKIFASVPVIQDDPEWRCGSWIRDALAALLQKEDSSADVAVVVEPVLSDWNKIREFSESYVLQKLGDKRYETAEQMRVTPIWSMVDDCEIQS